MMSNLLTILVVTCVTGTVAADKPRPEYIGPRERFWRHHVTQKSLVVDGVDHYHTLLNCLNEQLSEDDRVLLEVIPTNQTIGKRIVDDPRIHLERWGKVILVEIRNAITPAMVKAVRGLSHCVKTYIPKFHEVRPMYQEYNLPNDDANLGGNTPTHLLPFLGVFLPQIMDNIVRTTRLAYDAAGWRALTVRDEILGQLDNHRAQSFPAPEELGFRASEHLSYADFPLLDEHHDGLDTAFTVNFAFSGPDDYQGGFFYIIDDAGQKTFLKPNMYSCIVLLGGNYLHGVTQITGGHREMFSNELWYNPDLPLGTTLWTSNGENMEDYIQKCNAEEDQLAIKEGRAPQYGAHQCKVGFSDWTDKGMRMDQIREKYRGEMGGSGGDNRTEAGDSDEDDLDTDDEPRSTPKEGQEFQFFAPPHERYMSEEEQPNFLIPKSLQPGQMAPLYFRDTQERIRDDEAFVIGLPPELLLEFNKYMEKNGMLETAKKIAYELERSKKEHQVLTLADGKKWGIMHPKWDGNDMVWIDPGDEECFESLMDVLRKGNFDIVLKAVGEYFDLDGLMIQGIGPIFISYFEHDPDYSQIHHDLIEARGSFYNVIVPLYLPEGGAPLYVGDRERDETIQMTYNVGTLLGAGTNHGTGECNYRDQKDVRLSVAIYLADVNDDILEIVASDSTSLWPTQGDVHWFKAQQGRLWRYDDPSISLKNDKGRQAIHVQNLREDCQEKPKELCESDPDGFRLECPKTCRVYMEDDEYYSLLGAMVNKTELQATPAAQEMSQLPTCSTPAGSLEPTCNEPATAEN